jgi:hypothetical protein
VVGADSDLYALFLQQQEYCMQSEGDPKPFYIGHDKDGTRDEYVPQDGWSEVVQEKPFRECGK